MADALVERRVEERMGGGEDDQAAAGAEAVERALRLAPIVLDVLEDVDVEDRVEGLAFTEGLESAGSRLADVRQLADRDPARDTATGATGGRRRRA
jgi:hypothetical protein